MQERIARLKLSLEGQQRHADDGLGHEGNQWVRGGIAEQKR